MDKIETHPVQARDDKGFLRDGARCPTAVTLAAYEVYSEVFSPQPALITGGCRGGFGMGELVAFLYARSFPRKEWKQRVDEALTGMENF